MNPKWYYKYAEKIGATVNKEVEDIVVAGLMKNLAEHKAMYCPCKTQHIMDNMCPCKDLRENKHCHCMLFLFEETPLQKVIKNAKENGNIKSWDELTTEEKKEWLED
jgi:ferredoxin-thioredoxin reductase catalytic subunit